MPVMTRRTLVGAAAASVWAGTSFPVRGQASAPKKRAGLIGCGWYGRVNMKAAVATGQVEFVALCDVDTAHLDETEKELAGLQSSPVRRFKDYRKMLALDELDLVVIATPPHWHALPFIAACERGLHIYGEKPLAYDVREGRAMVEAWRKAGNVVQIGFQRRQSDAITAAGKYVQDGHAGEIVMVDANIHYNAPRKSREHTPPPETLDWDFWCGPAPKLPYSEAIGHIHWRLEKEYGHGHLVDWGIHVIDGVRNILGETTPKKVTAAGGLYEMKEYITTPDTLTVQFDFETCPVVWRHRIWGSAEYRPEVNNGMFFFGTKETVFATDDRWIIIPKNRKAEPRINEIKTSDQMQRRHWEDFLHAVETREPARVTPEDGYFSTATVQLGMIAYETASPVDWDRQREEIVNNPDASKLLERGYRPPWKHPA